MEQYNIKNSSFIHKMCVFLETIKQSSQETNSA